MQKETDVYLLTGSNIEPRMSFLQKAAEMIAEQIGIIKKQSAVYESEPWGFDADLTFLNQVVMVKSVLSAEEVLKNILDIEQKLDRTRVESGYASRTIDVDILYYGAEIINNEKLTIPHPRLQERNFTLKPLVEIAADYNHPVLQKTNKELLETTADTVHAWIYKKEDGI